MIVISFIFVIEAIAQDIGWTIEEEMIRRSPRYIWGEGINQDKNKAIEEADFDLISKIQVDISVSFKRRIEESKNGLLDVTSEEKNRFTGLYIYGLERLYFKTEKEHRVFSYILKDSLEKSFERKKGKILDIIKSAQIAESEFRIGETLRNFYWAFLLTHTYPYMLSLDSTNISIDPLIYISGQIRRVIDDINVQALNCRSQGPVIIAPLKFSYQGKSVKSLQFSYCTGQGANCGFVQDSNIEEIELYEKPRAPTMPLALTIEYAYSNEMRLDNEIKCLYNVFKEKTFEAIKSVRLNFPWLDKEIPVKEEKIKPEKWPRVVNVIASCETRKELFQALRGYLRNNKISVATRWEDLVGPGEKVYCVLFDEKSAVATLCFSGSNFKDVKSFKEIPDLREYSGKKIAWFKEVK
jgi:hypothetical protein